MSDQDGTVDMASFEDFLRYLEEHAQAIPYIDPDYDILVVEESARPIIIMNSEYLKRLEKEFYGIKRA